MVIRPIIAIALAMVFPSNVSAQNFKKEFEHLLKEKDTASQMVLLSKWKAAKPNDPEMYVGWFNYYVNMGTEAIIKLDRSPSENAQYSLKDSTGNIVGYLADDVTYIEELLNIGFRYIDTAIRKYPTRLDMRFGRIYMLGQLHDYDKFSMEIINTIDYSAVVNNKWLYADNEPLKNGKDFMLGTIQSYTMQLYEAGDEHAERMKQIAGAVLKYYPDHVESLSNMAIAYIIQNDYDNALNHLLKAETLAPTDFIVLNNIAEMYWRKNDRSNARKYYNLVMRHGDKQAKELAKERLEALR